MLSGGASSSASSSHVRSSSDSNRSPTICGEVNQLMNLNKFGRRVAAVILSALSLHAVSSLAQTWPQRTVKFVVPLGPGAGSDLSARLLADRLTKSWSQPVVV